MLFVVRLTKSLVEDLLCLTVLKKLIVVIVFAEKLARAFALQKLLTFFRQKKTVFFTYNTFRILMSRKQTITDSFFLIYQTEFVLFLVVLENSVLPMG